MSQLKINFLILAAVLLLTTIPTKTVFIRKASNEQFGQNHVVGRKICKRNSYLLGFEDEYFTHTCRVMSNPDNCPDRCDWLSDCGELSANNPDHVYVRGFTPDTGKFRCCKNKAIETVPRTCSWIYWDRGVHLERNQIVKNLYLVYGNDADNAGAGAYLYDRIQRIKRAKRDVGDDTDYYSTDSYDDNDHDNYDDNDKDNYYTDSPPLGKQPMNQQHVLMHPAHQPPSNPHNKQQHHIHVKINITPRPPAPNFITNPPIIWPHAWTNQWTQTWTRTRTWTQLWTQTQGFWTTPTHDFWTTPTPPTTRMTPPPPIWCYFQTL